MSDFTAIVVGGGPAGLAAACLLGQAGVKTGLVSGRSGALDDPRTVALMLPSIRLLESLEVWPGVLKAQTRPLRKLRLIDDTGAALAAPPLTFSAEEMGEEAFGWNVPLKLLLPELKRRALEFGVVAFSEDTVGLEGGSVRLSNGEAISASVDPRGRWAQLAIARGRRYPRALVELRPMRHRNQLRPFAAAS